MHGEIFPSVSFTLFTIACPSLLCQLDTIFFLFWPHWPTSQKWGANYRKPLSSYACFQLNSNLAIAKMWCYKDVVEFLRIGWLYNACSSAFPAGSLSLQALHYKQDSTALFKITGHKQTEQLWLPPGENTAVWERSFCSSSGRRENQEDCGCYQK